MFCLEMKLFIQRHIFFFAERRVAQGSLIFIFLFDNIMGTMIRRRMGDNETFVNFTHKFFGAFE
jgi:hypothetical protein